MTSLVSRSLAAMVMVVSFTACKKQGVGSGVVDERSSDTRPHPAHADPAKLAMPAVLAHVPVDTPYLLAGIEAMPPEVLARFKQAFASLSGLVSSAWQREREKSKVFDAILSELDGKWSEAGIESLGFSAQPRFAVYGLGLQPIVVRVAVKDHAAVQATINRIAAKAGAHLPAMTDKDGRGYWRHEGGDGSSFVLALADNQVVFAIGKTADIDATLGHILGLDKPRRSMADGALLKQLMARHRLGGQLIGFVDSRQMIGLGLDAAGVSPSPACKAEIDRLSAKLPRMVFGYGELSARRLSSGLVFELAPDAVAELRSIKAEIPGLASALAVHPLLAFAGGVDLTKAQQLGVKMLGGLKQLGTACALGPLVDGADRAAVALGRPLPEPFGRISGGAMIIDDFALNTDGERAPTIKNIDGVFLISSPDARALFSKASALDPDIRKLGVVADGKLHPVSSPLPLPVPVTAGVGARTIVVTLGDKRRDLGAQLLTTPGGGEAPLLAVSYDMHRLMDFAIERGDLNPDSMEVAFMQQCKAVLGQMSGTLDVTDQGLAFWATIELK